MSDSLKRDRQVDLRRRGAIGVELLQRRLQHVAFAAVTLRRRARPGVDVSPSSDASSIRSTTRPPRIWNTWTTAPAGPTFRPNTSRSPSSALAIFCCRSRSVSTVRIASRSCAACSNRSRRPRLRHPLAQRRRRARRSGPRETAACARTATPILLLRADLAHARRDAALDVVLEARPAALAGDHLVARPDPEQPVRQRHRPARRARRQERAGVEVPSRSTRRATSTRGNASPVVSCRYG